ncbi:MAG TPA: DUF4880 domain-containing protein [Alcaligenes sp.]|nr:DUF4880 domain-containing protein [Alcaligenes sp.]HRL27666.1 DUF4880 domain-containing protein [Alcaligenes sp.]
MRVDERVRRIDDQALEWLVRESDGMDARSQSAFRAWLDIDPEHQAAYRRWQAQWEALGRLSPAQLRDLRAQDAFPADHTPPFAWMRRLQDVCEDFWLAHPARRPVLGGALALVAGLVVLGGLGRYVG